MHQTFAAPRFSHYPEQWHLSPVVKVGSLFFFSGQTGSRQDGSVAADVETQFRDAFDFLGENLAACGLGFADIVEMTTYHVGLRQHLATFTKVKDERISAPFPAWSAIGVSELITEGTLLEIRVVAHRASASDP